MPRPATGRRPDSLFDGRYRYDHIYPRGRSGETLRAYDTQAGDAPVVIKRPALQDAPPIRAGQEVNILTEKRALEALSGHPVLTELRHHGTFRVGGQQHQYIVMDMAQGETVEAMVLDCAARGERLPPLEMLNILDGLLDLLQAAHDRRIVYNDVDAKHLFWDRERYRLKMIDWGNAVFLDADSHTAQHVTRAADILQTGELIYFILSGGQRFEHGRENPADDLTAPENADHELSAALPRLQMIVNRAAHPDSAARYPDVAALRHDLAEVRRPIQKGRDLLIERARARLAASSSQSQFEELRSMIVEALRVDPGYPAGRQLLAEVDLRLKQLAMQADLDAVRIYIESASLGRALKLLDDLMARLGEAELPLLHFLRDCCEQLETMNPPLIPAALSPALTALFRDDAQGAARVLLTTPDARAAGRLQQMLIAERLARRMPGIVLLRPHLVRLEEALAATRNDRLLSAVRSLISQLDERVPPGITPLTRVYQRIADILVGLEPDLQAIASGAAAEDHPGAVAGRARDAADMIVELLEVVSQNVLSDSSRAGNALWRAAAIDPANPAFDALNERLAAVHADLDAQRGFVPALDGGDIAAYLARAQAALAPYAADVRDPRFQDVVNGIETAIKAWAGALDSIVLGGRKPAVDACRAAAEAIRPLNRATALWFEEFARKVDEAQRVEQFSPNSLVGKALAEGWEQWDRGRSAESMQAGKRAADAAQTEAEKLSARRLIALGEALDKWLDKEGPTSVAQTEAAERRVAALFLPEEDSIRARFAAQMPNLSIYLKAMSRGVVEPLRDASAAGVRVLFFTFVLKGMAAVQREQFEEANTWKEAAAKSLPNARTHPAFQLLENAIVRRQLILDAVRILNNTRSVTGLAEARAAVRAPLAAAQLDHADQAMRAIEDALRRWPDGDFRAARALLDTAVERIELQQVALGKDLTPFKTWLQDLADSAEICAQARRGVDQAALLPADTPDPAVAEALQKLVDVTRRDLGDAYTAQLRQWRDTYAAIRDVYTDAQLTRDDKLRLLEGHFASLFIDRQPAYPIFRHWREMVRLTPDPEAETAGAALVSSPGGGGVAEAGSVQGAAPALAEDDIPLLMREAASDGEAAPERRRRRPAGLLSGAPKNAPRLRGALIAALLVIVLVGAGAILFAAVGGAADSAKTLTANLAAVASQTEPPTSTPLPASRTPTVAPTATPTETPIPPTNTPIPPTDTPEQSVPTPTPIPTGQLVDPSTLRSPAAPTEIPTLSAGGAPGTPVAANPGVPLPTLIPDATEGEYDVLAALDRLPAERQTWDKAWFRGSAGSWQLGNATVRPGRAPLVRIGPEVLTPLFGADAARLVKQLDVEFELVEYADALLPFGQVFFGAGFETLQGQRAAVEMRLVQPKVMDVGINSGRFQKRTQIAFTEDTKLVITVERGANGPDDRALSLYLNGQLLGASNPVFARDVPLTIYLYTSTGGVLVDVKSLTIRLDE